MSSNHSTPIIRIAFPNEFPATNVNCRNYPHLKVSRLCQYPGLMVEIVSIIADYLNSTIIPYRFEESSENAGFNIGTISDGKVSGLMGEVQNGNADTIAYPMQESDIRREIFDFTLPLYHVECNVVHRKTNKNAEGFWTFFTVYDDWCWEVMFIILLLQAVFYIVANYSESNQRKFTFQKAVDSVWLAIQIQLGQAVEMSMTKYAVKFNFFFVSLFQGVILMGVYSSWILSQKLAVDTGADLNNNAELIKALEEKSRYFVSSTASNWFYEAINRSDAYPFRSIREALKNNPIRLTKNNLESLEEANNAGGLIALIEDSRLMYLSKQYPNIIGMDEPVSIVSAHLILKKGSPLKSPFDEAILKSKMLIKRAFRKYADAADRLEVHRSSNSKSTLTRPYFGLFIIYSGLIVISIICVIVECLIGCISKKYRKVSPRSITQLA